MMPDPWHDPQPEQAQTFTGWAGSAPFEAGVRATWVMDCGLSLSTTWGYSPEMLFHLIAHEIGHVLGLSHSTVPNAFQGGTAAHAGWNPNSDYESRLMTDRQGYKRNSLPKRLIKGEWDMVRSFGGFETQAP